MKIIKGRVTNLPVVPCGSAGNCAQSVLVPLVAHNSGKAGLAPWSARPLAVLLGAEWGRVWHDELDRLVGAVHAVVGAAWRSERRLSRRNLRRAVDGGDVEGLLGLAHLARMKVG